MRGAIHLAHGSRAELPVQTQLSSGEHGADHAVGRARIGGVGRPRGAPPVPEIGAGSACGVPVRMGRKRCDARGAAARAVMVKSADAFTLVNMRRSGACDVPCASVELGAARSPKEA